LPALPFSAKELHMAKFITVGYGDKQGYE